MTPQYGLTPGHIQTFLNIVTEAMLTAVDRTLPLADCIRYLDALAPQILALGDAEGSARIRQRAMQYRRMLHEMTEIC